MTNEIMKFENVEISTEDIRKYFCPNATDKEFFIFVKIAQALDLNPIKREIYFIKYGTNPAQIVVGYQTYIKRAERSGKLKGWKVEIGKDDFGTKAILTIKRSDFDEPFVWEVHQQEVAKEQATWKSMPLFMLKKVAIAQGFRMCFPDELSGMPHIPEEITAISLDSDVYEVNNIEHKQTPKEEVKQEEVKHKVEDTDRQKKLTNKQMNRYFAILNKHGVSHEEVKAKYKFEHLADLDYETYDKICREIEGKTEDVEVLQ